MKKALPVMFELGQFGHDLVKLVSDAEGAAKVYQFGKQRYDDIKGFIGKKQMKNIAHISSQAAQKLKYVAAERLSEPSPNILTPIVEGAMRESREELQELWAALLANSIIDGGKKVRRKYLDVLKQLEPSDVATLRIVSLPLPVDRVTRPNARHDFNYEKRSEIGLEDDEWQVSVKALAELGCVNAQYSGEPIMTPFARMLIAACEVR